MFERLRTVVWSAVSAALLGALAVVMDLAGADAELTRSIGVFGVILAILSAGSQI